MFGGILFVIKTIKAVMVTSPGSQHFTPIIPPGRTLSGWMILIFYWWPRESWCSLWHVLLCPDIYFYMRFVILCDVVIFKVHCVMSFFNLFSSWDCIIWVTTFTRFFSMILFHIFNDLGHFYSSQKMHETLLPQDFSHFFSLKLSLFSNGYMYKLI